MGGGIAACLANVGFSVDLLDVSTDTARDGLARVGRAKPPHFYDPEVANRIRPGGIDQNLDRIKEADWVCEAVVERLEVKRALYRIIEPLIRPDAMISTNTSGLPISLLGEAFSPAVRRRFMGTHFFNPPRYLKLLELIPTPETDRAEVTRAIKFLEQRLGRRVVVAKDTPGFIANRLGMWSMIHAVHVAERLRLSVEAVDAITGPFLGRPRSGSFRLNDLVGVDIMFDIARNLADRCPNDPGRATFDPLPRSIHHLIERGALGMKTGQGYFTNTDPRAALDLEHLTYRDVEPFDLPSLKELGKLPLGERVARALELKDDAGEFLRRYLVPTLQYAAQIGPEIAYHVEDIDRVMRWGFGWEMGPFEMIDAIGPDRLGIGAERFYQGKEQRDWSGQYVPRLREPEYRTLDSFPVVDERLSFRVFDLGEGILGVGLSHPMGVLNHALVRDLLAFRDGNDGPVVIAGLGRAFSAGFDLKWFLAEAESGEWGHIETALADFQRLNRRLSSTPTVAAVHGFCLGGGWELALACPLVVAHPEATLGLPEARVGLIPAGLGTTRLRMACEGRAKDVAEMAARLVQGTTASGAYAARKLGFLRESDEIVVQPDALLAAAVRAARNVRPDPTPAWTPVGGPLPGMIDDQFQRLRAKGEATELDILIGERIKSIFIKATDPIDSAERERLEFMDLIRRPLCQARIRHMIENGRPLRN